MNRITKVLSLCLLAAAMTAGCHKGTSPTPPLAPGAYNAFDQQSYQVLSASQATLNSLKGSVATVPQIKDALNQAIQAYNAADAAYQVFHAALAAGQQPATTPVTTSLTQLQTSIAAVQSAATGGK